MQLPSKADSANITAFATGYVIINSAEQTLTHSLLSYLPSIASLQYWLTCVRQIHSWSVKFLMLSLIHCVDRSCVAGVAFPLIYILVFPWQSGAKWTNPEDFYWLNSRSIAWWGRPEERKKNPDKLKVGIEPRYAFLWLCGVKWTNPEDFYWFNSWSIVSQHMKREGRMLRDTHSIQKLTIEPRYAEIKRSSCSRVSEFFFSSQKRDRSQNRDQLVYLNRANHMLAVLIRR